MAKIPSFNPQQSTGSLNVRPTGTRSEPSDFGAGIGGQVEGLAARLNAAAQEGVRRADASTELKLQNDLAERTEKLRDDLDALGRREALSNGDYLAAFKEASEQYSADVDEIAGSAPDRLREAFFQKHVRPTRFYALDAAAEVARKRTEGFDDRELARTRQQASDSIQKDPSPLNLLTQVGYLSSAIDNRVNASPDRFSEDDVKSLKESSARELLSSGMNRMLSLGMVEEAEAVFSENKNLLSDGQIADLEKSFVSAGQARAVDTWTFRLSRLPNDTEADIEESAAKWLEFVSNDSTLQADASLREKVTKAGEAFIQDQRDKIKSRQDAEVLRNADAMQSAFDRGSSRRDLEAVIDSSSSAEVRRRSQIDFDRITGVTKVNSENSRATRLGVEKVWAKDNPLTAETIPEFVNINFLTSSQEKTLFDQAKKRQEAGTASVSTSTIETTWNNLTGGSTWNTLSDAARATLIDQVNDAAVAVASKGGTLTDQQIVDKLKDDAVKSGGFYLIESRVSRPRTAFEEAVDYIPFVNPSAPPAFNYGAVVVPEYYKSLEEFKDLSDEDIARRYVEWLTRRDRAVTSEPEEIKAVMDGTAKLKEVLSNVPADPELRAILSDKDVAAAISNEPRGNTVGSLSMNYILGLNLTHGELSPRQIQAVNTYRRKTESEAEKAEREKSYVDNDIPEHFLDDWRAARFSIDREVKDLARRFKTKSDLYRWEGYYHANAFSPEWLDALEDYIVLANPLEQGGSRADVGRRKAAARRREASRGR